MMVIPRVVLVGCTRRFMECDDSRLSDMYVLVWLRLGRHDVGVVMGKN